MTELEREALIATVAGAIGESRAWHEAEGLSPATDEALARVAVRAIGGAR